jgi:pyrimidine-nucleoside phosphorylase
VLVPLVAACGAAVPQLSGRGLGHTGGTLDKMEAIAGWRAELTPAEMIAVLQSVGGVIAAAGPGLVPADRKLYALRDVTGTVESIPLIASSIMSKKIAEGTDALVLDVKFGAGAFLPDPDEGRLLAETMVALGAANGVRTAALQTAMDTVLGRAAGNGLEVTESVETLAGGGPADLVEVTVALAREMVELAGIACDDPAVVLTSGRALPVWREMVCAQGGDPDAPIATAPEVEYVRAERTGVLTRLDARAVGVCAWRLGAGRARKEDPVSEAAGVVCRVKPGDAVAATSSSSSTRRSRSVPGRWRTHALTTSATEHRRRHRSSSIGSDLRETFPCPRRHRTPDGRARTRATPLADEDDVPEDHLDDVCTEVHGGIRYHPATDRSRRRRHAAVRARASRQVGTARPARPQLPRLGERKVRWRPTTLPPSPTASSSSSPIRPRSARARSARRGISSGPRRSSPSSTRSSRSSSHACASILHACTPPVSPMAAR